MLAPQIGVKICKSVAFFFLTADHVILTNVSWILGLESANGKVLKPHNRSVNLDGPIYVGGLPNQARVPEVKAEEEYVGCMISADVNGDNSYTHPDITTHGDVQLKSCPTIS